MSKSVLSAVIMIVCWSSQVQGKSFGAVLKGQTAFDVDALTLQQQEWLVDIESQGSVLEGDVTIIGRFRLDAVTKLNQGVDAVPETYGSVQQALRYTSERGDIALRELYWEKTIERWYWRLGKQQVVWGEADGLKLLDVINPQSFREFILDDFDDSRIPLWMVNAEVTLDNNGSLQLLWIPDTTVHDLAPDASSFALTSPLFMPQISQLLSPIAQVLIFEQQAPDNGVKDSDIGIKYAQFIQTERLGSWDISFNYLYHYIDTPVTRVNTNRSIVEVRQVYERSHLLGGSASTVIDDWTLRAELAYETDRYVRRGSTSLGVMASDQISSVMGIDWQGWSDQFVSLQWFQTSLLDYKEDMIPDRTTHTLSLLWQSSFLNQTLNVEYLHLHSMKHDDGSLQATLSYNYSDNLDIYLGFDAFYGNKQGVFGQFNDRDRIVIGFEWSF